MKKKINYQQILFVEVDESKGATKLRFGGYVYRYKKNYESKKLNREFLIYYCEGKKCSCCIREDIETHQFFHIMDYGAIRQHKDTCKPKEVVQFVLPEISLPPKINENCVTGGFFIGGNVNVQPPPSTTVLGKRPRYGLGSGVESIIYGILLDKGPLAGGNRVDIYFSVSEEDGMNRFLDNNWVGYIRFGTNNAPKFGKPNRLEDTIGLYDFQCKNHDLRSECSRAQFVIQAIVPRCDIAGYVNVLLSFFDNKIITKINGYEYVVEKNKPGVGENLKESTRNESNFYFEDEVNIHQDYYSNNNESGKDVDLEFLEEGDPVFGSPGYYNMIAQNRIGVVKKLLEKKIIDLDRRDLMGFSALDVAKHFKRREIEELLNEYQETMENITTTTEEKQKEEDYCWKEEEEEEEEEEDYKIEDYDETTSSNESSWEDEDEFDDTTEEKDMDGQTFYYKKISNIGCMYCNDSVILNGTTIEHKCGGRTKGPKKMNGKRLEEMRATHVMKDKRHKVPNRSWVKTGKCEKCKKCFSANMKLRISSDKSIKLMD